MTRRHLFLAGPGARLAATLDLPTADQGLPALLIVSGGNEPRSGPGGAYARLAARIATAGHPVLRFDRRGVGDSEGSNLGFRDSLPDIAAALAALRHETGATRVAAFGNCDAASALMLGAGLADAPRCDALALANPWTLASDTADTGALRAHYRRRLESPAALLRLLTGKVALAKLAGSLAMAARGPAPNPLARDMAAGLAGFAGPVRLLIAGHDRTADAFLSHWDRADPRLRVCPGADHGFLSEPSMQWLMQELLALLALLAAPSPL